MTSSVGEVQHSAILSSLFDAVITTDHHHRILVFNQAAERLFRIDGACVINTSFHEFIPFLHNEASPETAVRADGETFFAEISRSEVIVAGERLLTLVVRDVSERQQAEQALRDSEERFRTTFDQAAVGIAHIQLDGHWLSLHFKTSPTRTTWEQT
jgi:PAS domain-containing protein